MDKSPETTRSLDRAIDILEILSTAGPCALHEVQRLSGLPKSTVKRLLEALARRNLVRRGLSDGAYRLNIAIPQPGDATHGSRVAQLIRAASPHIIELTAKIGWPVDLHIFNQGRMQIIETTHALSPFDRGKPDIYDVELNVFAAASGIAFLSTLPDDEISVLIETLAPDPRFSMQSFKVTATRLFREVEEARKTGFARRLIGQTGAGDFNAVATPIGSSGSCAGAISVWWPRTYLSETEFLKDKSATIAATARAIFEALQDKHATA